MRDYVSDLKIRRSYTMIFWGLIVLPPLCTAIGTLFFAVFIDIFHSSDFSFGHIFIPIGSFAMYLIATYSIHLYLRLAPKISIKKDTIKINRKQYRIAGIKTIMLSKKVPIQYPGFIHRVWGMQIVMDNGETVTLCDDYYSNLSTLKLFLDKKINSVSPEDVLGKVIAVEEKEIFKGNQFTTWRGIFLWGGVLMMADAFLFGVRGPTWDTFPFFAIFMIFWLSFHSWLMYYFSIDGIHLKVRNHNFFWICHKYPLNSIKRIVYESEGNNPNCVRIITKDYKNIMYRASTLRSRQLIELQKSLKALGISVTNKCVVDKRYLPDIER